MHQLSTSTYMPNFIEIEETFVDRWVDGHIDTLYQVDSSVSSEESTYKQYYCLWRHFVCHSYYIHFCLMKG